MGSTRGPVSVLHRMTRANHSSYGVAGENYRWALRQLEFGETSNTLPFQKHRQEIAQPPPWCILLYNPHI